MNEPTFPTQSIPTLIKATVTAIVIAVSIFITIVLPAEYNIDPTGAGELLGLTALSKEGPVVEPQHSTTKSPLGYQENETTIVVPANKGVEYKFQMKKYAKLTYEWSSQGKAVFFDFHGEPKGDTTGYFESYAIANTHEMKGSMTVPFEGVHGWYWKNASDEDITITLKTRGNYEVVGLRH
tara:strand:- start:4240 stop:4782 length:543 start_codon:yes stop_codon:yes gene_type:complete